jgi:hypothetical protein
MRACFTCVIFRVRAADFWGATRAPKKIKCSGGVQIHNNNNKALTMWRRGAHIMNFFSLLLAPGVEVRIIISSTLLPHSFAFCKVRHGCTRTGPAGWVGGWLRYSCRLLIFFSKFFSCRLVEFSSDAAPLRIQHRTRRKM